MPCHGMHLLESHAPYAQSGWEKLPYCIMTEAAEAGRALYSFKIAMILRPSFTDFAMVHQSIQTGTERNKRRQPEGLLEQKR